MTSDKDDDSKVDESVGEINERACAEDDFFFVPETLIPIFLGKKKRAPENDRDLSFQKNNLGG